MGTEITSDELDKRNEERAELVRGLRELADFLADHPEVEFPRNLSSGTNWSNGDFERPSDDECIARIDAWKAAGFEDDWPPSGAGHHCVIVTFAGFRLRLSYVEDGKSHPIAWGKKAGEPDAEFQARVDNALAEVS